MNILLCMVSALVGVGLGPTIVGFDAFTQFPEIPFLDTTVEQDELVDIARETLGDREEQAPIEACEALIADETLPFALRSWAVRRKMQLCTYVGRIWDAHDTGRAWLDAYGDEDPYALEIRVVIAQNMTQRAHADRVPLYDDVHAVFNDIFENHPPDNFLVIQSHYHYAQNLERLALMDHALKVEGVLHCGHGVTALEHYLEKHGDDISDTQRESIERSIRRFDTLARRLMMRPSGPAWTEEAYINMMCARRGRERAQARQDQHTISGPEIVDVLEKHGYDVNRLSEEELERLYKEIVEPYFQEQRESQTCPKEAAEEEWKRNVQLYFEGEHVNP